MAEGGGVGAGPAGAFAVRTATKGAVYVVDADEHAAGVRGAPSQATSSSLHAARLAVVVAVMAAAAAWAAGYAPDVAVAAATAAFAFAVVPLIAGLRRLPDTIGFGDSRPRKRRRRAYRFKVSAPLLAGGADGSSDNASALRDDASVLATCDSWHPLGAAARHWCATLLEKSPSAPLRSVELRLVVIHKLPQDHPDADPDAFGMGAEGTADVGFPPPVGVTQVDADTSPSDSNSAGATPEKGTKAEDAKPASVVATDAVDVADPAALTAMLRGEPGVPLVGIAYVQVLKGVRCDTIVGSEAAARTAHASSRGIGGSRRSDAIAVLELPLLQLSGVFLDGERLDEPAQAAMLPRIARAVLAQLAGAGVGCVVVRAPTSQQAPTWPMAPSAYAESALIGAGMVPVATMSAPGVVMPVGPRAAGVERPRRVRAPGRGAAEGATGSVQRTLSTLGASARRRRRIRRALDAFGAGGGSVRWAGGGAESTGDGESRDVRAATAQRLAQLWQATIRSKGIGSGIGARVTSGVATEGSQPPGVHGPRVPSEMPAELARAWDVGAPFFSALLEAPASSTLRVAIACDGKSHARAFALALGRGSAEPWSGREGPLALRMGAADTCGDSARRARDALTAILCDTARRVGAAGDWGLPASTDASAEEGTAEAPSGSASTYPPIESETWFVDVGCGGYEMKRALQCKRVDSVVYALIDGAARAVPGRVPSELEAPIVLRPHRLPEVASRLPEWSVLESDEARNKREAREVLHAHREREFYRVGAGLGAGMSRHEIRRQLRKRRRMLARAAAASARPRAADDGSTASPAKQDTGEPSDGSDAFADSADHVRQASDDERNASFEDAASDVDGAEVREGVDALQPREVGSASSEDGDREEVFLSPETQRTV